MSSKIILFAVVIIAGSLVSCNSDHPNKIDPKLVGGGCSYEKNIDTFLIDSFVNDSTPYYILSKGKGQDRFKRDMSLIDIYHHNEDDTVLFQNSEYYLGKRLILEDQRILTGACTPYGINSIRIID
jgi:hypothetical protein